jgi:hypothetical protein
VNSTHPTYPLFGSLKKAMFISSNPNSTPGGNNLKIASIAIAVFLGFIVASSAASAGMSMHMSDKHMSMVLPTGWVYHRNYTIGGTNYDSMMERTGFGMSYAIGLVAVEPWIGDVTGLKLFNKYMTIIENLTSDPNVLSVTTVLTPENTTVSNQKAIDAMILIHYASSEVRERVLLIASDDWNLVWGIIFGSQESDWGNCSTEVSTIISSIAIDEPPASMFGTILIVLVGVSVAVIVIVLVILVRRRRNAPDNQPLAPPAITPMPPEEPRPPVQ